MQKRIKTIFPRYMWKIVVSTAVLALLFGISSFYSARQHMEQDLEHNLNYCLSYFNSFFDGMAYANYSLALDPTVSEVMASPLTVDPYDYKTTLEAAKRLQAQLSATGVASIYLVQEPSEIVFATGTGKVTLGDFRDSAFLEGMRQRSIPSVTQRRMDNENIITLSTRYSADRSTAHYSYLCFNIKSSYLENQLDNLLRRGYTVSLSTGGGAEDTVTLGQGEEGAVFAAEAPLNSYYIDLRVSYPQSRFWQEFFLSYLTQCGMAVAAIALICAVFFWTFRSLQKSFRPMLLSLANSFPHDEPARKLTLEDLRKSFDQLMDDRQSYREQLQEARRWAEEKSLSDLLQGNIRDEADFAALCPAFPAGEQGPCLVACVQMIGEHTKPQEDALARALVRSVFSQKGPRERFSQAVDVDFESVGLLVEYEEGFAEEVKENLQRKIESAKKSLPRPLGESLFVSAVLPVGQFAQISPAYRRAKANMVHRYILVGTPFIFTDMSGPDPENLMSPAEIDQIASAVNIDRLDLVVEALREGLGGGEELSDGEWYKLKSKVLLAVGLIFNQAFLSVEAGQWPELYGQARRVVDAESLPALQVELQRLTEMISQETFSGIMRSESGSRYVRQAYQYMKEHYDQELSVSDIAEALSVNVKYLSRLFKQESGQTMTHYIASLRLKKAVSLLEGTSLPIYKVGAQVGFHDVRGFIRLFKKEYGMTPNEYRACRPQERAQ